MRCPMIGVIADDVTGGTDAAAALRRRGLRTRLGFGVPTGPAERLPADAAVLALKTRTAPAADAVRDALAAADHLTAAGAGQLYFKFCSTFDSTPRGTIGPVLDALSARTGARPVVTAPATPEHGRTQYLGHLFVHERLLAESSMRHHPLTPMTDSLLPRLLDAQSAHPGSAVLDHRTVAAGPVRIRAALDALAGRARYVFPDALDDGDLLAVARAVVDAPLVAGAAGLVGALGAVRAERGLPQHPEGAGPLRPPGGRAAVLAGSCARRTLEQIDALRAAGRPAHLLDPLAVPDPDALATRALRWYDTVDAGAGVLIHASRRPDELRTAQRVLGVARSARILEAAIGAIAVGLARRGVARLVVAGGETSGAVVAALGIAGGEVGVEAARGVPWIHPAAGPCLLLKSGNFGDRRLLLTASAAEGEA
ncbi:3-oxo-tetronate kinase [Streptomyces sp. WZ-12]|uniref:3-oxo-tetronate kinase n=1 Tax=Streptomyces sp. WZ-12 TaxID=3030210 RepID=UPI003158BB34